MLKTLRAMRQASREYQPPPITIGQVLSITAVVTALYFLR
jgi:hypothetical protein